MPILRILLGPTVCVLSLSLLGVLLAPANARPFAYVSGVVASGPGTVVIDTATDVVIATIAAGTGGMTITPDGTRAYVVSGNNAVAVIDTATNTVIATVTVNAGTRGDGGIAITPDGTGAYVGAPDHAPAIVSVIDTDPASSTYNTVVATVDVAPGIQAAPFGVAITPDSTRAYVTVIRTGTVAVIDTASNTVVQSVTLSPGAAGIAISPDGTRAYVASDGDCVPTSSR